MPGHPATLYARFEQHVDGCGVCQGNFFCEIGLDLFMRYNRAEDAMNEAAQHAANEVKAARAPVTP